MVEQILYYNFTKYYILYFLLNNANMVEFKVFKDPNMSDNQMYMVSEPLIFLPQYTVRPITLAGLWIQASVLGVHCLKVSKALDAPLMLPSS